MEADDLLARATRGFRKPSLDARSRSSISPHPRRGNEQAWREYLYRSMRAVRDGLPTPSGESEESEDPRWTRAVKASLATPLGEMRNRENPHRLYAETADHTQRDTKASDTLADGTASGRMTVKTVADLKTFIMKTT